MFKKIILLMLWFALVACQATDLDQITDKLSVNSDDLIDVAQEATQSLSGSHETGVVEVNTEQEVEYIFDEDGFKLISGDVGNLAKYFPESISHESDQPLYSLAYTTLESFDDVLFYFNELLEGTRLYYAMKVDETAELTGRMNDKHITVRIHVEDGQTHVDFFESELAIEDINEATTIDSNLSDFTDYQGQDFDLTSIDTSPLRPVSSRFELFEEVQFSDDFSMYVSYYRYETYEDNTYMLLNDDLEGLDIEGIYVSESDVTQVFSLDDYSLMWEEDGYALRDDIYSLDYQINKCRPHFDKITAYNLSTPDDELVDIHLTAKDYHVIFWFDKRTHMVMKKESKIRDENGRVTSSFWMVENLERDIEVNELISGPISVEFNPLEYGFDFNFEGLNIDDTPYYSYKVSNYTNKENDVLRLNAFDHRGFSGQKLNYYVKEYSWNNKEKYYSDRFETVWIKGVNYYKEVKVNDNENYQYYFIDDILYKIDWLTHNGQTNKAGYFVNYNNLYGPKKPSYHPFDYPDETYIVRKITVDINGQPMWFEESLSPKEMIQRLTNIKTGIIENERHFDFAGKLIFEMTLTESLDVDISDEMLTPPDIDYQDLTKDNYMNRGYLRSFEIALDRMFVKSNDMIMLLNESENQKELIEIFYRSYELGQLIDPVYRIEKDGYVIRTMRDGLFYRICDTSEEADAYGRSVDEDKFFDINALEILFATYDTLALYNPENIGVSEQYKVYEYQFDDFGILSIQTYYIEDPKNLDSIMDKTDYTLSYGDFDETVYNKDFKNSYKIYDYGETSIDDGEHRPFWLD
ncbi:hypothetical protein EZV73_04460 [Acidaminobacter sp. JC074]|uniref:hypothetical protein n=1 Tax=Acidaminobacter sp. JC074 TaxID=2530199 RepID=UPI001F0DB67E|nr:hypothetical protein [Acidaminobacter sp. JC074]MCH4886806.1 hypothetical protein [Acidaminobacter sp. JC074]